MHLIYTVILKKENILHVILSEYEHRKKKKTFLNIIAKKINKSLKGLIGNHLKQITIYFF